MQKGLLAFTGTIDLTQFWPQNIKAGNPADSDADTVKVSINRSSVTFRSAAGRIRQTHFMDRAGFFHTVTDSKGNQTSRFQSVVDSKGRVNLRLQGIDAPELHYMTQVRGNPLYRQPMGETATVQLYTFLRKHAAGTVLDCEVFTQVDEPNDVFDKYGRLVGDIVVKDKKQRSINVNQWLVKEGYAFPAYYNSMTPEEITALNALAATAQHANQNIWKYYANKTGLLDRTLTHNRKDAAYSAAKDRRPPVLFPKLYRRLWTFEIQRQEVFTTQTFQQFVAAQKSDRCCRTTDFLKSGYPKKSLLLGSLMAADGRVLFDPADIVIQEAGTTLKDKQGRKLTRF